MTTESPDLRTTPQGDRIRDKFVVMVNSSFYRQGHDVLLAMRDWRDQIVAVAERVEFKPYGQDDLNHLLEPTFQGADGKQFLQAALEAAWEAGLRPKNWKNEAPEQIVAMNAHLQDMRALVFTNPPTIEIPDVLIKLDR